MVLVKDGNFVVGFGVPLVAALEGMEIGNGIFRVYGEIGGFERKTRGRIQVVCVHGKKR